jgi:hypothetical protein
VAAASETMASSNADREEGTVDDAVVVVPFTR